MGGKQRQGLGDGRRCVCGVGKERYEHGDGGEGFCEAGLGAEEGGVGFMDVEV